MRIYSASQKEMLKFIYPEEMIRKPGGKIVCPDTEKINEFIKDKLKTAFLYRDSEYTRIAIG